MKIAVVGTGYVGLVVGVCLAENGNNVVCVDKDRAKIRTLRRGTMPIYEPGLEEMVRRNRAERPPEFTHAAPALRSVAPTSCSSPSARRRTRTGRPTCSTCWRSPRDIARAMNGYKVIVDKSTVPVGTAASVRDVVRRETTHPFSVVSNPEFLKQGAAIEDFMKPDRVVIGAEDPRAAELMTRAVRAVHPDRRARS